MRNEYDNLISLIDAIKENGQSATVWAKPGCGAPIAINGKDLMKLCSLALQQIEYLLNDRNSGI